MSKEIFDFKKVAVTTNAAYLQPGMYNLSVREAKYIKPEGKKPDGSAKTTYLELTFGGEMGQLTHKYFITPKAFDRLQTIYTAWFEKGCDKVFDSTDAIGAFFELAFNSEKAKSTYRRMIIAGRQVGDKVYADLPYSNYIVNDDVEDWKEGPFAKDSGQYIYHVKMEKPNPASSTDDVMIPVGFTTKQVDDFSDDLPF